MKLVSRKRPLGFTLIELLVVIFIVGIVTGVALLSFGHNQDREIKTFANEIAQVLKLAQDRALLEAINLGFVLKDDQFYFVTLEQGADGKLGWKVVYDHTLSKREIPKNINVNIQVANAFKNKKDEASTTDDDEDDNPDEPQVIIYSNSDFTPFTITVGKVGHRPHYAIIGRLDGNLITKTFS